MRLLTLMLLLCALFACSDEWKKKDEVTGDGLKKGTAYEILEGRGNFTIFLEAVNRIGYRDLLDGKGLSTLFVPNDDAFRKYFAKHNISSLDDIEDVDLELLIGGHILKFAYRETELNNFQPQTGMEDLPGVNYRHMTVVMPPIEEVYSEKMRRKMKLYNNYKFLPVFSTNLFTSLSIPEQSNFNYFYPESKWNSEIGLAVGNASIIESQIPNDNGYLYIVDQVIEPLKTVYECFKNDADFTDIKEIYDRFLTYTYSAANSLKYGSSGDSLFFMGVENPAAYPLNNLADQRTISTDVWETPMFSYSFNAFLPTNKAMQQFFTDYFQDSKANDQRYSSWKEVDKLTAYYLLSNHVLVTNPAFPDRITANMKNSWGYAYDFDPGNAVRREVCGNGVFIGIDEMQVPAPFLGVTKPVFQSPGYKMFAYILSKSGLLQELSNSAAEWTLLIPSDDALKNAKFTFSDPGNGLQNVQVKENGTNMTTALAAAFINNYLIQGKLDKSVIEADEMQWYETASPGNYIRIGKGVIQGESGSEAESYYQYEGEGEWSWSAFDLNTHVMNKTNWLQVVEKSEPYSYKSWLKDNYKEGIIKNSTYFVNGSSPLKPFTDNRGIYFVGHNDWVKNGTNDIPSVPKPATNASKKEMGAWLDKHVLTLEDNPDLSLIDFITCTPLVGKEYAIHSEGWSITVDDVRKSTDAPVVGVETELSLGEYTLTLTVTAPEDAEQEPRTVTVYGPHMATDCIFFIIRNADDRFVYTSGE